jgi:hypothetical protein
MPSVTIKGRLVHPPGAGGLQLPVGNADVRVLDLDVPGKGDDVIWQGKTDAQGRFGGASSEWRDNITVMTPFGMKTVADASDLLLLRLEVKQGVHGVTVSPFLNDAPVPVVVPWPAPLLSVPIAVVNGKVVTADKPDMLYEHVKDLAEAGEPAIRIMCLGNWAKPLEPLLNAGTAPAARALVLQRLGLPADSLLLKQNPADWAIVACCAIICLAVVATAVVGVVAILATAVVLATVLGYRDIRAKTCNELGVTLPAGYGSLSTGDYCFGLELKK